MYRYCLIQYYFKGGREHPVEHIPHGNSKKKQDYIRTWESTKGLLEEASDKKKPRDAVHHVMENGLGGLTSCVGLGQMPRNRQQSSDLKRNKNKRVVHSMNHKNMSGAGSDNDPWYLLLNESKRQSRIKESAFVRDVRVGGEPFCVLASNRQLNDIKRFCCNTKEFKPLTVDPTFNLGQFNVTPISYQHLLLETRKEGKHPTLIGPVLLHERKTEETYSLFCGSLKALEPELSNLLAFGTDDELALINGFNNNFERATHLLCEIHLKKNIESRLSTLAISGKIKQDIMSDLFGKRNEDVFESGLSDSSSDEDFYHKLGILKDRWSKVDVNGKVFYEWFVQNKEAEFLQSVISPVRQRAGLGCPPERFTTNRSERTNGVIQDFVKRECGQSKVDEYVFAVTLQKLISIQEREIEFAVVDKGEYKLRPPFKHLLVPAERWSKKTNDQMKTALKKVHTTSVDHVDPGNVASVCQALDETNNLLLRRLLEAGVDWIPRDSLALMAAKASRLEGKAFPLPGAEMETVMIPSKSKPKKPHAITFQANGKCECQDCPGYSSSSVCAHAIAASVKLNRLDTYLKWLVTTRRKTGGVNYSKAITFGMPAGRGRKPNQPPRKRSKTRHPSAEELIVVQRITEEERPQLIPSQRAQQHVQTTPLPSGQTLAPVFHDMWPGPAPLPPRSVSTPTSVPPVLVSSQPSHSQLTLLNNRPGYPSPVPNSFIIYLLNYCPKQTSVCFGCGSSLKPGGLICNPPGDLVVVSNMYREWRQDGQMHRKLANVYFHCIPDCIRRRQPYFQPDQCFVPRQIEPFLNQQHRLFIGQTFGNIQVT